MIMRKLKLESLQVESFETTSSPHGNRGTVRGHADVPGTTTTIQPGTGVSDCAVCQWSQVGCYPSINICRDTEYLDCTFGCTRNTCDPRINSCGQYCWIEDTARCVVEK
jgi:hypothetical protein